MIMEPLSVGAFLRVPPCLSGEIEPASGKYLFFKISRKRSKENILKIGWNLRKLRKGKWEAYIGFHYFNIFLESESDDKKGRAWRVKALAHQTPEWHPFIFSQSSTTGHPSPPDLTSSFFSKAFFVSKIYNAFWDVQNFGFFTQRRLMVAISEGKQYFYSYLISILNFHFYFVDQYFYFYLI